MNTGLATRCVCVRATHIPVLAIDDCKQRTRPAFPDIIKLLSVMSKPTELCLAAPALPIWRPPPLPDDLPNYSGCFGCENILAETPIELHLSIRIRPRRLPRRKSGRRTSAASGPTAEHLIVWLSGGGAR